MHNCLNYYSCNLVKEDQTRMSENIENNQIYGDLLYPR